MTTIPQPTIHPSDLDSVAELLDSLGVEYTRHDRGSDREVIAVPGYGSIWHDPEDHESEDCCFVVDLPDGTQDSLDPEDLERELREVGAPASTFELCRGRKPRRLPLDHLRRGY